MTFIVWSPNGPALPRVTFDARVAAQADAERLAARHPGQTFHVCQLLSASVTEQVRTTELTGSAPAAATAEALVEGIVNLLKQHTSPADCKAIIARLEQHLFPVLTLDGDPERERELLGQREGTSERSPASDWNAVSAGERLMEGLGKQAQRFTPAEVYEVLTKALGSLTGEPGTSASAGRAGGEERSPRTDP